MLSFIIQGWFNEHCEKADGGHGSCEIETSDDPPEIESCWIKLFRPFVGSHCRFFHMAALAAPVVALPPEDGVALARQPILVPPPPRKGEVVLARVPVLVLPPKCEVAPHPTPSLQIWEPEIVLDSDDYSMPDRCVPPILEPSRFTTCKSRPCPPPLTLAPLKQWGDGSYVLTVHCLDPMSLAATWERLEKNKRKSWLMMDGDDSGILEDGDVGHPDQVIESEWGEIEVEEEEEEVEVEVEVASEEEGEQED